MENPFLQHYQATRDRMFFCSLSPIKGTDQKDGPFLPAQGKHLSLLTSKLGCSYKLILEASVILALPAFCKN